MSIRKEIHFFSTNKHFIEMLGYTEEEFEAHTCWYMEDLLVESEKIQTLLHGMQIGDEIRGEVQFKRKDGTFVWAFGNIYRTDGTENDAKYACSCIDIDAGKRAKDANEAKTMFLSNMSHDMRTPLNTIINLASLAHDDMVEKDKLTKDLDKIEMAGEFLLGLINDILDMSKIESGKIELHPTVYSFQEFINYIDGIIVPICSNKDIHFVCKIESNKQALEQEAAKPSRWGLEDEEQAEDLWVDKIRFNQIFFNLLSNAVKYTDAGGQVIFEQQNVKSANGMHISDFVITDTGRGMSKEFQRKLYIPFEREHTEEAYTGTGLGLSITRQIVDLMGGEIRISSEENKGTKVWVHLEIPFATQQQEQNHKDAIQKIRQATINEIKTEQKNILIVEDHPLNQEIACRILQKKGYVTECVCNGKDAVDKIEQGEADHFQAILMDIRMPIMDGITATKKIRELSSEYAKSIPIIAMTANAFEEDVRECLDAGMNAHLAKPITPAKLYETLAMFVDMK